MWGDLAEEKWKPFLELLSVPCFSRLKSQPDQLGTVVVDFGIPDRINTSQGLESRTQKEL